MHNDVVCLDSVVVAVDGVARYDIDDVAPKLSAHLEATSHQSIASPNPNDDDETEPDPNKSKIASTPLHITGNRIKNSRNKLLSTPDDDEMTVTGADDGGVVDHNVGCDNQSFSKSESAMSVKIDVNNANEIISDDVSSIASSSVRNSFTQTKDPDDKKQL